MQEQNLRSSHNNFTWTMKNTNYFTKETLFIHQPNLVSNRQSLATWTEIYASDPVN